MNIGFDAKRAFHNDTGLGYYSRTLIRLLAEYYPDHQYYLFNPKPSKRFTMQGENLHEILPSRFPDTLLRSVWRSSRVRHDMKRLGIDVYHGLSHEIPVGIRKSGIKSVVTIHDLMPERFPEHYKPIDVKIYHKKFLYACRESDHIIAISDQTKQDIIEFYGIPAEKISICLQSCSPVFKEMVSDEEKTRIAEKYGLPPQFYLSVGTIIERKNLLNVCKAFYLLRNDVDAPLVVIGNGGKYKQQVKDFILQHHLEKKIIFLSERKKPGDHDFLTTKDLAVIYQSALAMLYPSFFEGFGAPILEALWSRLPVITSNVSCMPEVGGPAALYVDPNSATEIAEAIHRIDTDPQLVADMKAKGLEHTKKFAPDIYAASIMDVYRQVVGK